MSHEVHPDHRAAGDVNRPDGPLHLLGDVGLREHLVRSGRLAHPVGLVVERHHAVGPARAAPTQQIDGRRRRYFQHTRRTIPPNRSSTRSSAGDSESGAEATGANAREAVMMFIPQRGLSRELRGPIEATLATVLSPCASKVPRTVTHRFSFSGSALRKPRARISNRPDIRPAAASVIVTQPDSP
jgi:hypothetical protein